MSERNVLIQVTNNGFYARGTETWWHAHVSCNDAAAGTVPDPEVGGWDRNLAGRLHPLEIIHVYPLPERLILDVEETIRVRVTRAWEDFLESFNQGR